MKYKMIFFAIVMSSCVSLMASSSDQSYLHSNSEYTFTRPTGNNEQVVYPLTGIKAVLFSDHKYLDEDIEVLERTSQMEQFACSTCHDKNTPMPKNIKSPHSRIKLSHGKSTISNCFVCHNKNDRDTLNSNIDNSIPMNQSAKMCFQCHSSKYQDWTKGAHGKRIGNWTGRRVIFNCTQCHDPHSPSFDKRMPKAIPVIRGVK